MENKEKICNYIKSLYPEMKDMVLLHCPQFLGNEKKYLNECIDTKFVSYVSHFVTDMEESIKKITGAKFAVAMVNGTEALHMAIICAGINSGEEIITQSLTFAATSAAIVHCGASPIFIDVDIDTMGMSPNALKKYLESNTEQKDGKCYNKKTGKIISACIPMHTFGHPCRIDEIKEICDSYNLILIEDSAESIGSSFKGKMTGTFGKVGILSFNGNKCVTTGAGGMLITDDEAIATRARYISTTAKKPSKWEFFHTEAGYNLRMPGTCGAIGAAQLEYFEKTMENKRETAKLYQNFFAELGIECFKEPKNACSNYWLNAIILKDKNEREEFLEYANSNGVQCRPIWTLMHKMPPYENYERADLYNSEWLEDRVVNIPSSVRTSL
ncbi:LegC family aminotransferase [Treponema pectinovorum]|uniref:LegC family aminotransferase n=1 Tax=Treponema pectinovorum TaxID=164 RepID=UPI0011C76858|nr:LegC family aminotransferase [Treponema pectinovorum]